MAAQLINYSSESGCKCGADCKCASASECKCGEKK